jgi:transglutaminase-like putative cysteine protease
MMTQSQYSGPPAPPAIRYRIEHVTAYDYSQTVSVSHHIARLRPRSGPGQTLRDFRLEIRPRPTQVSTDTDYFGNVVDRFPIQEPHDHLEVTAHSEVEVAAPPAAAPAAGLPWELVRERVAADHRAADCLEAYEFVFPSGVAPVGADFADYAAPSFPAGRPIQEAAMDLTTRIHRDFTFDPAATTVSTPVSEVLRQRRGVCQDFAHLQIACLRSLGLPARYVSGYVRTDPPPGLPRLVGVDATHAWVAVFSPDAGWVEYDPTNQCRAASSHVRVATGRDYLDISPLRGTVIGGGLQKLSIAVTVTPMEA